MRAPREIWVRFRIRFLSDEHFAAILPADRLVLSDGERTISATRELARRYLEDIATFLARAEPWHLYDVHVKQYSECRCGATTNAPGPHGWKWRRIIGLRYAARKTAGGWGRRSESLCPACQVKWGV